MAPGELTSDIPPGLEIFQELEGLFVEQNIELKEIICGCCEGKNTYRIASTQGQFLTAKEESNCCIRVCCGCCCGKLRPFTMTLKNYGGETMLYMERPWRCNTCWFPCCLQSINVYAPPDILLGSVKQTWSCFPRFNVRDVAGNTVLKIKGPMCCLSSCCGCDVEFKLIDPKEGIEVGKISKKWSGLLKEMYTDADNFGITFPKTLSPQLKATLLGACLLIDYMFFEKPADKHPDHPHS